MYTHTIDPAGKVVFTLVASGQPNNDNSDASSLIDDSETKPKAEIKTSDTLLVSSRHLILASCVFKSMLSEQWGEGNTDLATGLIKVSAEGFNADALLSST